MIDFRRALVTGGAGMVGQALPFGIKPSRDQLDVTDPAATERYCANIEPSAIICLSSINLHACEREPIEAYHVNVFGAATLAKEARRRDIPLVIVSTGAVFNGPSGSSFDEDATPSPVNLYGQTKWLSEEVVRRLTDKHLILRTGWLFGRSGPHRMNLVDQAYAAAQCGRPVEANVDQEGSPTYVRDFVETLENLLDDGRFGLFHVVNANRACAAEIADEVSRLTNDRLLVQRRKAHEIDSSGVRRSASEVLTSRWLFLRPWKEALASYVEERLKQADRIWFTSASAPHHQQ